jgi:hypothetical protein
LLRHHEAIWINLMAVKLASGDQIFNSTTSYNINQSCTLAAWFYCTALSPSAYGSINVVGNRVGFWIKNTVAPAKIAWYAGSASPNFLDPGPTTVSLNTWTHLAMTHDGANAQGYINGVADGSSFPVSSGVISNPFMGGATDVFVGSIADFVRWNVALTVLEIKALAAGVRPNRIRQNALRFNAANPPYWWPCDYFSNPMPDITGNGINGDSINGSPTSGFGPPFAPFNQPRWQRQWIPPPDFVLMPQIVT